MGFHACRILHLAFAPSGCISTSLARAMPAFTSEPSRFRCCEPLQSLLNTAHTARSAAPSVSRLSDRPASFRMLRSRPSSSSAAAHYEALFQASSVELHIPEVGQLAEWPADDGQAGIDVVRSWWAGTEAARSRDVAFFGQYQTRVKWPAAWLHGQLLCRSYLLLSRTYRLTLEQMNGSNTSSRCHCRTIISRRCTRPQTRVRVVCP